MTDGPNTIEQVKTYLENVIQAQGKAFLPDLNIDLYHHPECPGWSNTALGQINKTPANLKAYKSKKSDPKDWGDVGNAVHTGLLEPDFFAKKYTSLPETVIRDGVEMKCNFATKEGKAFAAQAEAEGKIIVNHSDWADILGMIAAVKAHPEANQLITEGEGIVEGSMFWTDPDTKLLCKTRPDRIRKDGIVVELKTTKDASEKGFRYALEDFRYHVQGSFQMDGSRECLGLDPKYFVVIAVEKTLPYNVAVYAIAARAISFGRGLYKQNLAAIKHCEETNTWPGYPTGINTLDLSERAYEAVQS